MKILEKIKSVSFVSKARLCHEHKTSGRTNNFFYAKIDCPEKALSILYNV
jgi:hypothetical protein